MATIKARVEHLLKEAKEYDPDKRFMAANDLCAELLKDQEVVEANLVKQICSVFLTQLDDISIDVQGNAVRCIKRIVSKIHETQVSEVISKLGDCLKTGKEEFRDIYATCLKGLISDVPEKYAAVVCDTMMPILVQCILNKNYSIAEEALEILTDLIKKFSGQLHTAVDRSELVHGITSLLVNSKSSVKKKATNCIGAVSLILPVAQLQNLLSTIIKCISNRGQKRDLYSYVQALGAISRNVGEKLTGNLRVLFEILLGYCETSGLDMDSSTIETDCELIETCLNAIEFLVKRCAKDILEFVPSIMNLVLKLTTYDPNYSYNDAEEEVDDDWGSDDDSDYGNPADDSSWKIRRAALNVLDAVIKSRPEILSGYYTEIVECLVKGFKEREENVKLDVFHTFSTLIKSVLIGEIDSLQSEELPMLLRTRSSAEVFQDLLPMIVQKISTELQSKSLRTRQAVTSFMVDLSLSFPHALSDSISIIQPGIIKNLEDVANSALRINTLTICKRIFRVNSPNNTQFCYAILPQIQLAIKDSYYKITAEALKLIGNIVKMLSNENRFILAVFPLVLEKLGLTDIDQEVKQAVIYSSSTILAAACSHLQKPDVRRALELITDRLRNEVTRGACLKAWVKISQSPSLPPIDLPILQTLAEELHSLLKKSLRSLKLSTLETMIAVSKAYDFPGQNILTDLPSHIIESDLQVSQASLQVTEILLSKGVNVSSDTAAVLLGAMNNLAVSAQVHGNVLSSLCAAYRALIRFNRQSAAGLVAALLDRVSQNRKSFEITAQCVAAICLVDAGYTHTAVNSFIGNLNENNELNSFSALCIGEIGLNQDLSAYPVIPESFIKMFAFRSENSKICASVALGKIAVGNLERYLPLIFREFAVESHRYLLLNSIEEVITHRSERMAPYVGQILPVLFENAERSEENVRNISAECLGKLISVSPEQLISNIITKINEGSVLCKITMVSSIKYAMHHKISQYSEYMERILPILLECLNIPEVLLRKACLVSLNSISHNAPSALKQNFSFICEKVLQETIVRQDLIKKVDLGAFTHINDEGLPLRKSAFGVIETFLEHLPEKIDPNRILEHIISGLDDPSDEVQMLCHQLLSKLIHLTSGVVSGNLSAIAISIRKNVEKNHKLLNSKQEVERATDVLRSALRCVEKIEAQIEAEASGPFKEFLVYVASVPELEKIMAAIKSQREGLFFI